MNFIQCNLSLIRTLLNLSFTSLRVSILLLQFIAKKSFSSLIYVLTRLCFLVDLVVWSMLLLWLIRPWLTIFFLVDFSLFLFSLSSIYLINLSLRSSCWLLCLTIILLNLSLALLSTSCLSKVNLSSFYNSRAIYCRW